VTFDDIADRTGLSVSTVYRIRSGKFRRGNRRHEAALEMLRSYNKQKIQHRREKKIICLGRRKYDGHTELLTRALETMGQDVGCRFTYHDVTSGEEVSYHGYDGCLLIYTPTGDMQFSLPTVGLNRELQNFDISSVGSDDVAGMMKVFKYLKRLGHRRIGFFDDYAMRSDFLSYRRAVIPYFYTLNGLPYNPELVYSEQVGMHEHPQVIRRAVDYFCSMEQLPTVIVLPGDSYAVVFYEQFKLRGISIPEDISFVGYDNMHVGECMDPALTTVDKPFDLMAQKAVKLLLKRIENPDLNNERILLDPELIIRNSVTDLNL
jgi:DNA-binding LacI/PurR family transcriptional regulator